MNLRIADGFTIPKDYITQTAGVLGIRGGGKSNLAAVLAEQMFAANLPFVVIDPTGTWVGLRSAGTGPGLGVVIFGGRERDVPLERGSGAAIADLIAEERLSSVVDVSELSEGDKVRFLTDFAKRLYRQNRDPLHLILEEADDYVPQKPFRDQAECLRAFQDIVRRGRARGLGITMVTQRSAVVSKDVLTQIETLFVLRTTSPQDRKAIEAWVDYHGQSRELVASLPSLKPGEAWVWSPHYLGTVARIQVNRRTTLDTAATPKDARGRRPPATKADVDLDAVTRAMAETIERAKADDPKELRRRIAELERERRARPAVAVAKPEIQCVEVPVFSAEDRRALDDATRAAEALVQVLTTKLGAAAGRIEASTAALARLNGRKHDERPAQGTNDRGAAPSGAPRGGRGARMAPGRPRDPRPGAREAGGERALTGPEQRILNAIAWLETIGNSEPEETAVAFLAGYTIGGGAFNNPRGSLRTNGLIEKRGNRLSLTDLGRALAEAPEAPLTSSEIQRMVLDRLPGPEARILTALIEAYPKALRNDELARRAGYEPNGGAFNNPRGRLRSLGLVDYPERGQVVARAVLFLEGARA